MDESLIHQGFWNIYIICIVLVSIYLTINNSWALCWILEIQNRTQAIGESQSFLARGSLLPLHPCPFPFWHGLLAGSHAPEVRQTDSQFCSFLKFSTVSSTGSDSFHQESKSHEPLRLLLDEWNTHWQIWWLKNLNKEAFKKRMALVCNAAPLCFGVCVVSAACGGHWTTCLGFVCSLWYPLVLVLLFSLPTIFPRSQTQPCLNFILLLSILTWNPKVRFIILLWNP